FSILISISLLPLARFLERLRLGKAFAAVLSVLIAIAIIWAIGWFIVHQTIIIGKDASAITAKVVSVLERAQTGVEESFGIERTEMMDQLREQGNKLAANAGSVVTATFGSIGNMVAGVIWCRCLAFSCYTTAISSGSSFSVLLKVYRTRRSTRP